MRNNYSHSRPVRSLLAIALLLSSSAALAQQLKSTDAPSVQQRTADKAQIRMPDTPNSDDWRPGLDYIALMTPWRFTAMSGKVTVIVRHQYTVPEYRDFEPYLKEWLKTKPDYIEIVRKPHIHYAHGRPQARIFLTLDELGRLDLNDKFYEWVWDKAHYPVYMDDFKMETANDLNLEFAKANGIDEAKFTEVYFSRKMDKKLNAEEAGTMWEGDSTFVINGRYMTDMGRTSWRDLKMDSTPQNFARLLKLVEYLAADELKHNPAVSTTKP